MDKYKIDCLVIGGGISGLAVARNLSSHFQDIFLIEKNQHLGQETSSRNSEVIHAGIYYKKNSLKAKLCLEGKELLYEYLERQKIDYKRCGKFIISTTDEETTELEKIMNNSIDCEIYDLEFNNSQIKKYPFIYSKESLFSPSTGIFDSHSFMSSLRREFEHNDGKTLLGNECLKIEITPKGFEILIHDQNTKEKFILEVKFLINAAGLAAVDIANTIYEEKKFKNKFIKGEYFNYLGKEKLEHLIYPTPTKYSIGLHATIDLGKGIRFGPSAYETTTIDYNHSEKEKYKFYQSVRSYWPSIKEQDLSPGYTGIRPTLEGIDDFIVDINSFNEGVVVNILGYSSPGLTSSLALSKLVESRLSDYIN